MHTSIESQNSFASGRRTRQWIALALCTAVLVARVFEKLLTNQPADVEPFSPYWIPLAAIALAGTGIMPLNWRPRLPQFRKALLWICLALMIWTANGLPFDLLRMTPLIPLEVDWPGAATRLLALAAAIVLAQLALERPSDPASSHIATWYGYAAFVLALSYPVLRTIWAFGGTLGLMWPGAAGRGFVPLLATIPWLLAAALSLLLISTRRRMPRRLLLAAGWSATALVLMVGPGACWTLVTKLMAGGDPEFKGIEMWVPCLFYGSWLLWGIAAGAATRSYQLRTEGFANQIKVGREVREAGSGL